ncbi:ubiquinol-cytochrome C chaperone [Methylobacterium sp. BTF04]|uniref:ubiquinol-cytochrome C chaperone family protein n=1 Tax=Methylobacterium sp. BTF04 TaxID=2708300 RepID=UPI0013D7CDE8|nr:ubiquinol-cytochrome C chaperone family protein [Methylobacterium sp. BTF04]NEU10918.1 ubiquinol-cytochrome C chaperone [Methylobacterium sp. BTF04]
MIRRLFERLTFGRTSPRERLIEALHLRINAAARMPGFYTVLSVPDTVEGRFECLSLHVILVLRQLDRLPPPADDVAQDLVNAVFLQLDSSLRELGVGDFGVPKRMKKLGAAFYARAEGYDSALASGDAEALARALARNVLGSDDVDAAGALARYVAASAAALSDADLDTLVTTGPRFPQPESFPQLKTSAQPETATQNVTVTGPGATK